VMENGFVGGELFRWNATSPAAGVFQRDGPDTSRDRTRRGRRRAARTNHWRRRVKRPALYVAGGRRKVQLSPLGDATDPAGRSYLGLLSFFP
jgi:hypothetical protein